MKLTLVVLIIVTRLLWQVHALSTPKPANISFSPSSVELDHVSKQHPVTWQRRFLSSVPLREFALKDVTLMLDSHQLILFQGASSSGKSTLLKAIQQPKEVTKGTVTMRGRPVYLDQRPSFAGRRKNQQVLDAFWEKTNSLDDSQRVALVRDLASLLGFDDDWTQRRPSDLSPSETYRFALLLACLESCTSTDTRSGFPAPILLLDEWMDTETSVVLQTVQQCLFDLVMETGALVCVVTHKGERWNDEQVHLKVTLCRGEILQIQQPC
jgi:ABC-type proline/glycine betaine transport system ATPase subunit